MQGTQIRYWYMLSIAKSIKRQQTLRSLALQYAPKITVYRYLVISNWLFHETIYRETFYEMPPWNQYV